MDKDQDILALFVENERKQKRIAFVAIALFLLLSVAIIGLAYYIQDKNNTIENQQQTIVSQGNQIDSLQLLLKYQAQIVELNKEKADLLQDNHTLSRDSKLFEDSLAQKQEEVAKYVEDVQAMTGNPDQMQDVRSINTNVIRWIQEPKQPVRKTYTIYIQYMKGFESTCKEIQDILNRRRYNVPPAEYISNQTFDPAVRYFKPEDEIAATNLAATISSNEMTFKPVFVKLKSAKNQLEIWIGKYEKPKLELQIQPVNYNILPKKSINKTIK